MKVQENNQHRNKHRGRLNYLGYCEAARLTARLQGYTVPRLHGSSAREETARWIDNRNGVVTMGSWEQSDPFLFPMSLEISFWNNLPLLTNLI